MSLEKIEERILQDARERAEVFLSKARGESEETIAAAGREARETAIRITESEERKTALLCGQILSQARMEAKSARREAKDQMVDHCFTLAGERMEVLRKTAGYPAVFRHLTEDVLHILGSDRVEFRVHRDDLPLVLPLIEALKERGIDCSLSSEHLETGGGVVVTDPAGKVRVQNTLEARFERMRRDLTDSVYKILFSPDGGSHAGR